MTNIEQNLRDRIVDLEQQLASALLIARESDEWAAHDAQQFCVPKDLVDLLNAIKPNYGDVGSRDIDVTAQRNLIDAAIAMLATPVPPVAPARTSRPPIDTTTFRELTMAYAKAIMHGSVPESSQAWGALVFHVEQWGEDYPARAAQSAPVPPSVQVEAQSAKCPTCPKQTPYGPATCFACTGDLTEAQSAPGAGAVPVKHEFTCICDGCCAPIAAQEPVAIRQATASNNIWCDVETDELWDKLQSAIGYKTRIVYAAPPTPKAAPIGKIEVVYDGATLKKGYFDVSNLLNGEYDVYVSLPAPQAGIELPPNVFDLGHGATACKGERIDGGHIWLMHNEHGLVRAFNASENMLIDAALAAARQAPQTDAEQSPYEPITLANLRAGKLSAARLYVGYCEVSQELKAANAAIGRYEALAKQAPQAVTVPDRAQFIERIVLSVAEIPDRDSPEDQPEMMLVTGKELRGIIESAFEIADETITQPIAAPAAKQRPSLSMFATMGDYKAAKVEFDKGAAPADPCPQCRPGGFCKTPTCGRLAASQQPLPAQSVATSEFLDLMWQYFNARSPGDQPSIEAFETVVNYINVLVARLSQPRALSLKHRAKLEVLADRIEVVEGNPLSVNLEYVSIIREILAASEAK